MFYLNAINASPSCPPTICTPPSGMDRPWKNWRMSAALADQGKFCSRIMTLIFALDFFFCFDGRHFSTLLRVSCMRPISLSALTRTMPLCRPLFEWSRSRT